MVLNFLQLKAAFSLLIFALAAAAEAPAPAAKTDKAASNPAGNNDDKMNLPVPPLPCRSDLTKSFGLDGIATSIPNDLDMCPGVTNSCCTTSDQITINESWNAETGLAAVKARFQWYQTQYGKVIEAMKALVNVAKPLSVGYPTETNCKQIARVLANFRVSEIETKLVEVQKDMENFFVAHYRGFYCGLCDATQHVFYDTTGMRSTMSQGHCRKLVGSTLPAMLYLHIHFPKILKLMVTFVSSCDGVGTFLPAAIDVENLVIETPANVLELLTSCKKNINSDEWSPSCMEICMKSSVVNLNEFFYPYIGKYSKIVTYLTTTMAVLQQASTTMAASIAGGDTGASGATPAVARRLQTSATSSGTTAAGGASGSSASTPAQSNSTQNTTATGGTAQGTAGAAANSSTSAATAGAADAKVTVVAPPKTTDPAKLYADPKIIEGGLNKIVNAENFLVAIAEVGLNPWAYGIKSLINKQAVDIAKAKLKIEKMGSTGPFSSVLSLLALGYRPDGTPIIPETGDGSDSTTPGRPSTVEIISAPKTGACLLNFFNETHSPTTQAAFEVVKMKMLKVALEAWMFTASGGKMGKAPAGDIAKPVLSETGEVIAASAITGDSTSKQAGPTKKSGPIATAVTLLVLLFTHMGL
jgi:hypothetical protein